MNKENILVPIEQKEVDFYEDELTAILANDGHIYVSVSHMCNALGIDRASQVRRIGRNGILADGYQRCVILTHHRGRQQIGVLRVDLVPMWLTGISIKSVKETVQPKLKRFQLEAAKALWEAFQEGRLTADPTLDELLQQDTDAVQAYKIAMAIAQIARNQILLEGRTEAKFLDYDQRLEAIEAQLGDPGRYVDPDQASQISQAVKAVAMILSKQSRSNQYGSVYGELYRKFGITSYKQLPAAKFEACMQWLTEWHGTLTSDSPF